MCRTEANFSAPIMVVLVGVTEYGLFFFHFLESVFQPSSMLVWRSSLTSFSFFLKVFKNHGVSAGASMSHSHSQMLALPIVPPTVSARLDSMKEYFDQTQKCSVCEVQGEDHLIDASTHFISVVPFAASFPFEIWIIPRDHSPHFHEINDEKVSKTPIFLIPYLDRHILIDLLTKLDDTFSLCFYSFSS